MISSLTFAETELSISAKDKKIIHQARKLFLFSQGQGWVKKREQIFDVMMGAYDRAEICKFVYIFLSNNVNS